MQQKAYASYSVIDVNDGLLWKGDLSQHPSSPQLNWAYYNTKEKQSYIYDGSEWVVFVKDGKAGNSVEGVTNFYYAHTSDSTTGLPAVGNAKWKTKVSDLSPAFNETNKYLWNYEQVAYSAADPTTTAPSLIGIYSKDGDAGRGITDVVEYYKVTSTSSAPTSVPTKENANGWTVSTAASLPKTTKDSPYLWNYEIIYYTSGNPTTSGPVCIGTYGNSIKSTTEYYAATATNSTPSRYSSGTTINTNVWKTSLSSCGQSATKPYVWNFERIVYTLDGSKDTDVSLLTTSPRTIAEITEYYQVSTSQPTGPSFSDTNHNTAPTIPSGWSTSRPSLAPGDTLWNFEVVKYAAVDSTGKNLYEATPVSSIAYAGTNGNDGEQGYSIVTSVSRTAFTEETWSTLGTLDHEHTLTDTASIRNGCRIGDIFTIVGTATDTKNAHVLYYRSTTASGDLQGKCISHSIAERGATGATGASGTSPYLISLSESFIAVPSTAGGATTFPSGGYVITPTVYHGTSTASWAAAGATLGLYMTIASSGVTASWDNKTVKFTAMSADKGSIVFTLYNKTGSSSTKVASTTFEAVKAKQGNQGISASYVYAVADASAFKKSDASYAPSSTNVTIYKRTGGGNPTSVRGSTYYYKIFVDGASSAAVSNSTSTGSFSVGANSATSRIDVTIYSDAYTTVVDKLTIGIIKDGEKGGQGDPGGKGDPGTNGDTVSTVYAYYKSSSATAPSLPTTSTLNNSGTAANKWYLTEMAESNLSNTYCYLYRSEGLKTISGATGGVTYTAWQTPELYKAWNNKGVSFINYAEYLRLTNFKSSGLYYNSDGELFINANVIEVLDEDGETLFEASGAGRYASIAGWDVTADAITNTWLSHSTDYTLSLTPQGITLHTTLNNETTLRAAMNNTGLYAIGGEIGGWKIEPNSISKSWVNREGEPYTLSLSTSSGAAISYTWDGEDIFTVGEGGMYAIAGTIGGWHITDGALWTSWNSGSNRLELNASDVGALVYSVNGVPKVVIGGGGITAREGTIGGWSLTSDRIYTTWEDEQSEATYTLSLSADSRSAIELEINNQTAFTVGVGGMYCQYGQIGGWHISSNKLGCSDIYLYASNQNTGTTIGTSGKRKDWRISSSNFGVTAGGVLYAVGAQINSGTIGGWNLTAAGIYKDFYYDNYCYSIAIRVPTGASTKVFSVNTTSKGDVFYVTTEGKLHAENAYVSGTVIVQDGGRIGGFSISDNALYAQDGSRNEIEISPAGIVATIFTDTSTDFVASWYDIAVVCKELTGK